MCNVLLKLNKIKNLIRYKIFNFDIYVTSNPNRPQSNKIQQGEVKKMR